MAQVSSADGMLELGVVCGMRVCGGVCGMFL